MTPYMKFKSLNNAKQYLKPSISFDDLNKIAFEMSNTDYAKKMQKEKQLLFKNIDSR